MAGQPHVPLLYRVAAKGLGASMWFFVSIFLFSFAEPLIDFVFLLLFDRIGPEY